MSDAPIPRDCRYGAEFESKISALDGVQDRREEMMRGVEWVLARTDLRGRVIVTVLVSWTGPRIEIYADVDDRLVEILDARLVA